METSTAGVMTAMAVKTIIRERTCARRGMAAMSWEWLSPSSPSQRMTRRARRVTRQCTSSAVMGPKSTPRPATASPMRQPAPPTVHTATPSTSAVHSHRPSDLKKLASAAPAASTTACASRSGVGLSSR